MAHFIQNDSKTKNYDNFIKKNFSSLYAREIFIKINVFLLLYIMYVDCSSIRVIQIKMNTVSCRIIFRILDLNNAYFFHILLNSFNPFRSLPDPPKKIYI